MAGWRLDTCSGLVVAFIRISSPRGREGEREREREREREKEREMYIWVGKKDDDRKQSKTKKDQQADVPFPFSPEGGRRMITVRWYEVWRRTSGMVQWMVSWSEPEGITISSSGLSRMSGEGTGGREGEIQLVYCEHADMYTVQ